MFFEESPLVQKVLAQRLHPLILDILKDRFGVVPRDVTRRVRAIIPEKRLRQLHILAATCPDVEAFRQALLDSPRRR